MCFSGPTSPQRHQTAGSFILLSTYPGHRKGDIIPHTLYETIHLKSLHQEIDLFDRKLAHIKQYGKFSSEADLKAATGKLAKKRATLAAEARQMAKDGVDFAPSELPRSFPRDGSPAPTDRAAGEETAANPATDPPASAHDPLHKKPHESPFAGTSLDGNRMLLEYKRSRTKKSATGTTKKKKNSSGAA